MAFNITNIMSSIGMATGAIAGKKLLTNVAESGKAMVSGIEKMNEFQHLDAAAGIQQAVAAGEMSREDAYGQSENITLPSGESMSFDPEQVEFLKKQAALRNQMANESNKLNIKDIKQYRTKVIRGGRR